MNLTPSPLMLPDEFDWLSSLYRAMRPERVLEIGTWQGGTLRKWLDGAPELVVAVDLEHQNAQAYAAWRQDRTELVVLTGPSQDPGVVSLAGARGPYDWLFIDGDHHLEAVSADVLLYSPMVRQGGVILLHDVLAPDLQPQPYPPGEVLAQYGGRAYTTDLPCDEPHGIGVIQVGW